MARSLMPLLMTSEIRFQTIQSKTIIGKKIIFLQPIINFQKEIILTSLGHVLKLCMRLCIPIGPHGAIQMLYYYYSLHTAKPL